MRWRLIIIEEQIMYETYEIPENEVPQESAMAYYRGVIDGITVTSLADAIEENTENDASGLIEDINFYGLVSYSFVMAKLDIASIASAVLPEHVADIVLDVAFDIGDYVCELIDYADDMLDIIEGYYMYYPESSDYAVLVHNDMEPKYREA